MKQSAFTLLALPSAGNMDQVLRKFDFPITLTKGRYRNLEFAFHGGTIDIRHAGVPIQDFSFVWLSSGWNNRDIAYAIGLYLESKQTPHVCVEKNTSKITDCMIFALNGLPIPDSVFLSRKSIEKGMPALQDICGYPLIVKDIRGAKGKDSRLIRSESELLAVMETLPKTKKFLFQKFIPNDYDWGIMVSNGIVVAGEQSYPKDGAFLNNAASGATERFVEVSEIPENLKAMAIQASALLGLTWSRADIIIDKNTGLPYLLEVNRYPGITSESSEVLGAYTFLASHIASERSN